MTAVASPPSLQPLQQIRWNSASNGDHEGGLSTTSAEDFSRMFMPRRGPQRKNSASSVTSSSSGTSDSTVSTVDQKPRKEGQTGTTDKEGQGNTKASRLLWSSTVKADISTTAVPVAPNGRPQPVPVATSSVAAAPAMSALHQVTPTVPSQRTMQAQPQINGVRTAQQQGGSDPPALLVLLPMNGTFERKQINVPQFPEILRIGRQTNAKTVPTPSNGYFDSKVLSRQHAEIWADRNGKIWIRDVKSSNGTFVNGERLSPESRDSEPHELRENDMLELGIDIVSEDQKSIVHHKVSAKIEHAGIHASAANVLDLNFGDIDPGAGGGLIGSMIPQHLQMRGRGGSQGSINSNGRIGPQSMTGTNMSGVGVQRHMNAWLSPITVEQVVKKLATELKQAKQQSQDLHRTNEFFTALLTSEPGQELPKPPPEILPPAEPSINGVISPSKMHPTSPFSQPPAPPPQLPLPEKPDLARSIHPDSSNSGSLKGSSPPTSSPTKPDPRILSLIEALGAAKEEIDSQGVRVRHLEELLKQERRARECAEERARHLLVRSRTNIPEGHQQRDVEASSSDNDSTSILTSSNISDTEDQHGMDSTSSTIPLAAPVVEDAGKELENKEIPKAPMHEKINEQFNELKLLVEFYKQRAESAEKEKQATLAEMVERIRRSEEKTKSSDARLRKKRSMSLPTKADVPVEANGSAQPKPHDDDAQKSKPSPKTNGMADASAQQIKQLQHTLTTALSSRHHDDRLAQSAPYVSILGVVLIGVGIMTYLNSWQKGDR